VIISRSPILYVNHIREHSWEGIRSRTKRRMAQLTDEHDMKTQHYQYLINHYEKVRMSIQKLDNLNYVHDTSKDSSSFLRSLDRKAREYDEYTSDYITSHFDSTRGVLQSEDHLRDIHQGGDVKR